MITTEFCSYLPIRQNLKQELPELRTIQRWSDLSESMQKYCFVHTDWEMFRVASENNIDKYADSVSEFIRKCIGDIVPIVTVKTYPNQKPWIGGRHSHKTKSANHRIQPWERGL